MLQKIEDNLVWILAVVAIVLLVLNLKQCQWRSDDKEKAKQVDNSIGALSDTIHKVIKKDGSVVFEHKVASADINDIINSEAFKNVAKEKQQYLKELAKTKNLLAAAQAEIQVKDSILRSTAYGKDVKVTDSTITFKKGKTIELPKDSIDGLTYSAKLTFADSLRLKLNYSLILNIDHKYTRQKDGSIKIEYNLHNSHASVTNGTAFIVPIEKKNKFLEFLDKTGRWIVPTAAFIGGVYVGTHLKF